MLAAMWTLVCSLARERRCFDSVRTVVAKWMKPVCRPYYAIRVPADNLILIRARPAAIAAGATVFLAGCSVGGLGVAVVGTQQLADATYGCFNRVCGKTPEEPHIVAAKRNDADALRQMIVERPVLIEQSIQVDQLLEYALLNDSDEVVRLLVPRYAIPNRQIRDPRNPYTYSVSLLILALREGCRSPQRLLESGASLDFPSGYPLLYRLAVNFVRKDNPADCLAAAKGFLAAGYTPSQDDLDSALRVAVRGWSDWNNPTYFNPPNSELADYLRSIGAVDLP